MTRWKKWLKSNGIKLEEDYECLPVESGSIIIEGVRAYLHPHSISVVTFYSTAETFGKTSKTYETWYSSKTGRICRKEGY